MPLQRPLLQRLGPGCLITALGAFQEPRRVLLHGLQSRLAAQGHAARLLPFDSLPSSGTEAHALKVQLQMLDRTLEHSSVLSEGGIALHAAELGASAPDVLLAAARAQLARSTLVLLCAAGAQASTATHAVDARLRSQLLAAKVSFSVLLGDADSTLEQAWQALCMTVSGPRQAAQSEHASVSRPWLGSCDACSDPACEHRLFSDLLQRRGSA